MINLIRIAKTSAITILNFIFDRVIEHKISKLKVKTLDLNNLKRNVLKFLRKMKCKDSPFTYYYSSSSTKPTLYSSVYACMILGILGELDQLSQKEKMEWGKYFDSFQNETDGLFYDPVVQNKIYNDTDCWGARHLALHIVCAYSELGLKPKYQFKFLEEYYVPGSIKKMLNSCEWKSSSIGDGDIDNKIMNIGCLLQYQRDFWDDQQAGSVLIELKQFLRSKINKDTGIWGGSDLRNPDERSRMVQFAYHLFPIFLYDGDYDFEFSKVMRIVLDTQNSYGGFGVKSNSSACEDIDSLDLSLSLFSKLDIHLKSETLLSINKGLNWVLQNQVSDGGFVFRLFSEFIYGHEQMKSGKNLGAMFPSWFRLLSVSNILRSQGKWPFSRIKVPGYYFF